MKHPLTILLALCLIALVGCGGGDAPDTEPQEEVLSPGETVEALAIAMETGDAETVGKLLPQLRAEPDFNTRVAEMAASAKTNGGIESVTIDTESIDDDNAAVTATLTNGNGQTSTQQFTLVMSQGNWVITAFAAKADAAE